MLGDNIYEDGNPKDFDRKFKNVYKNLPVEFHATLGNHDRRNRNGMAQVEDGAFGYVEHKDEYTFPAGPEIAGKTLVRFICLNSGAWKDGEALQEREKQLDVWLAESSKFHWNFVFFHHPIYSFAHSTWPFGWLIGRRGHGSDKKLQLHWEQRFANGGIDIVLSGHDHFYQKITPQSGIHYFVSMNMRKLSSGKKSSTSSTLKSARTKCGTSQLTSMETFFTKVRFRAENRCGSHWTSFTAAMNSLSGFLLQMFSSCWAKSTTIWAVSGAEFSSTPRRAL